MEIDLTLANTEVLEELAYWPLVENDDTKPRTKTCPFCGKKNAANAVESHKKDCLIGAAQHEYEQRLLTAERGMVYRITWTDKTTGENTIGWGGYSTKEKAQAEADDLMARWEEIRKGSTANIMIWVEKGEGR